MAGMRGRFSASANRERTSLSIKVTVIIPTLHEAGQLPRTLAGLPRREDVEMIVVDGGSRDDTLLLARQAGARTLSSAPGRAVQMNRGAAEAAGRFLVFLHADTRLPGGYAEEIERLLSQPGVVAGAFRLRIDAPGWGFRLIEVFTNLRSRILSAPYGDQALFLSAHTLRSLGGYREIPLLEDFDLVRRLCRCGKVVLSPLPATTSARRWRELGLWRTTLLNWSILVAYWLGASPSRLATWYRGNS